jgi:predicted GTPase
MELHGRIGPALLIDTPGINEAGDLGQLKRQRAFQTIGQSDVIVIVADPFEGISSKQLQASTIDNGRLRGGHFTGSGATSKDEPTCKY